MLDVAWTEMAVIAVLALIILGPKELPVALKTLGQWVGRARALAGEFKRGLDDIARETELDEVKRQIESAGNLDMRREIENRIDPTGEVADAFDLSEDAGDLSEDVGPPAPDGSETPPDRPARQGEAETETETPQSGADAPPRRPPA